mmetsp:Transcript_76708/g.213204  ORF Transcript_76708/g.213204 Transcript_76708/m.213204 type:complete len:133 (-) Transcript_76708:67-465(-)
MAAGSATEPCAAGALPPQSWRRLLGPQAFALVLALAAQPPLSTTWARCADCLPAQLRVPTERRPTQPLTPTPLAPTQVPATLGEAKLLDEEGVESGSGTAVARDGKPNGNDGELWRPTGVDGPQPTLPFTTR